MRGESSPVPSTGAGVTTHTPVTRSIRNCDCPCGMDSIHSNLTRLAEVSLPRESAASEERTENERKLSYFYHETLGNENGIGDGAGCAMEGRGYVNMQE